MCDICAAARRLQNSVEQTTARRDWRRRSRHRRRPRTGPGRRGGGGRWGCWLAAGGIVRRHGTGLSGNYGRKPSKIIWSACRAAPRVARACARSRSATASAASSRATRGAPRGQVLHPVGQELRAGCEQLPEIARGATWRVAGESASRRMATRPRGSFGATLAHGGDHRPDRTTSPRPGRDRPASTSAVRRASRVSPSNRLLISTSSGTRPATRSHSSPSVSMRSAVAKYSMPLQLGGRPLVEAAVAAREAAEDEVVMHHGFAVGADLHVAFDAVAGIDGGAKRRRGVLDDA